MAKTHLAAKTNLIAYNNAMWCDAVCRAHGIPGEFYPQLWLNQAHVPAYYPNLVTLSGESGAEEQLLAIQSLVEDSALASFAVKDSFNTLDLTSFGFHPLFEATWLWRAPSRPGPGDVPEDVQWTMVAHPQELASWEAAWATLPDNQQSTAAPRVFLPLLLADENVVFIAAYRDGRIVGGAVANRTGGVVGLSNQFAPDGEALRFWAGYIAVITEVFPDHAIVGYERGAELELARLAGFEAVAPFRVWIRPDAVR
jgi:hypothetical protein